MIDMTPLEKYADNCQKLDVMFYLGMDEEFLQEFNSSTWKELMESRFICVHKFDIGYYINTEQCELCGYWKNIDE